MCSELPIPKPLEHTRMNNLLGRRAVVVGAGIGGLSMVTGLMLEFLRQTADHEQ